MQLCETSTGFDILAAINSNVFTATYKSRLPRCYRSTARRGHCTRLSDGMSSRS